MFGLVVTCLHIFIPWSRVLGDPHGVPVACSWVACSCDSTDNVPTYSVQHLCSSLSCLVDCEFCDHLHSSLQNNITQTYDADVLPALSSGNVPLSQAARAFAQTRAQAEHSIAVNHPACKVAPSLALTRWTDRFDNCENSLGMAMTFNQSMPLNPSRREKQELSSRLEQARVYCSSVVNHTLHIESRGTTEEANFEPTLLMDVQDTPTQHSPEDQELHARQFLHNAALLAGHELIHGLSVQGDFRTEVNSAVAHLQAHVRATQEATNLGRRLNLPLAGADQKVIEKGLEGVTNPVEYGEWRIIRLAQTGATWAAENPYTAGAIGGSVLIALLVVKGAYAYHEDAVWGADEQKLIQKDLLNAADHMKFVARQFLQLAVNSTHPTSSLFEIKATLDGLLLPKGPFDQVVQALKTTYHDAYNMKKTYDDSWLCWGCGTPPNDTEVQELQHIKNYAETLQPQMVTLQACFKSYSDDCKMSCPVDFTFKSIESFATSFEKQSCRFAADGADIVATMQMQNFHMPVPQFCNTTVHNSTAVQQVSLNPSSGELLVHSTGGISFSLAVIFGFTVHFIRSRRNSKQHNKDARTPFLESV